MSPKTKRNRKTMNTMLKTTLALALLGGVAVHAQDAQTPAAQPKPQAALMVAKASSGVMFDVSAVDGGLVAVGGYGNILRSQDGRQWRQVASPVDTALTWLSFADAREGWAVGHDAVILHSRDGGASWKLQSFEPALNAPLFSVAVLDQQTVVAVGAFGTMKLTQDGGEHWRDADAAADPVRGAKSHLFAITKLRDQRLMVVGETGLMGVSADGVSWQKLDAVYEGSLFGVQPWGEHGAIVYGLLGNIFACEEVGKAPWRKIETQSTASLFGGTPLPDGSVALVGANGTVTRIAAEGVSLIAGKGDEAGRAGTWTGATLFKGQLLLAGESGLQLMALPKP